MLSKKEKQLSLLILGLLRRQQKQDKALILIANLMLTEHDFNLALSKSNLAIIETMHEHNIERKEQLEDQYFKWKKDQDAVFETQKKLYNNLISQFINDKATKPVEHIDNYAKTSSFFTK